MPRAYLLVRDAPWYRRQAFESGLKRAGYEVALRSPEKGSPGDVMVIWNRYGSNHEQANRFEKFGGTVLVAENGYIGKGGSAPKFDVHPGGPKPTDYYALARSYHNGRGWWPDGGIERWEALGIELRPWRTEGSHILVCPNRSFGVGAQVMHPDWAGRCVERLQRITKRPVRVRGHPGNDAPKRPLSEDLKDCWAVYVWSSSCAVHSLVAGIPTFIEAPYSVVQDAGAKGSPDEPVLPDRLPVLRRMAWGQWQIKEIESGAPFGHLLPNGKA